MFIEGVFLSPKIYSLKKYDDSEIFKMKGVPSKYVTIKHDEFKKLLLKNNNHLEIKNVERFFVKNLKEFTINYYKLNINLEFNSNKYIKLYDENEIFYKTKPIHINKEELILTKKKAYET